ncbi:MAG: hypothetical protein ACR2NR_01385 [Solirubrobacteraceae bacterium]
MATALSATGTPSSAAAAAAPAIAAAGYQRLGILPFDHERQLASVLVDEPGGHRCVITKGAPEVVLDRCVQIPGGARSLLDALFSEGSRVVAVASRSATEMTALTAHDEGWCTASSTCRSSASSASQAGGRSMATPMSAKPL